MIGERIRQRRTELGFSLRELGQRTGLTASFLSQVENSRSSPSLASLQRIATALETPMFDFLDEAQPNPVIRAADRPRLDFPESSMSYELLTKLDGAVMATLITLQPGGRRIAETLSKPTDEWMHVLSGRLEIMINQDTYWLCPGDTIYYQGRSLREFAACDGQPVQAICCITPPVL